MYFLLRGMKWIIGKGKEKDNNLKKGE